MRYRHRPGRTPNSIRYREIGDTNSVRKIAVSTNVVVVIVIVIIVGSVWISKKPITTTITITTTSHFRRGFERLSPIWGGAFLLDLWGNFIFIS